MSVTTEFAQMALRSVTRNKRRSGITGATIAIGVIAILFTKAYIVGLQALVLEFVVDQVYGSMQVQRDGYATSDDLAPLNLDIEQSEALERQISAVGEVEAVAPRLQFVGFINNGDTQTFFTGMAIDPVKEPLVCPRGVGAKNERLVGPGFGTSPADEVILGKQLAVTLNAKIGDTLTLLAQTRAGAMDAIDVTVVGIFDVREWVLNKRLVVTSLRSAQQLLHMPGRVSAYAIRLRRGAALDDAAAHVRALLSSSKPALLVRTWTDLAPTFVDLIKLQDVMLNMIIGIIFILVLAGVANTLMMSVFERTREIGTLMSLGFRRSSIVLLFLFEALALGLVSSLAGCLLAVPLITGANHWGLPFSIPGVGDVLTRPELSERYFVIAVLGTMVGALIGGLYPAFRASRLRPVEALRAN